MKTPTISIEAKDEASKAFESAAKNIGDSMKKAGTQVQMSMDQAKKKLSEYGDALGNGLKKAGTYSAGIIAGFAAMAIKSTKDLGSLAEEIDNMSKRTGISAQSIQGLRLAADQTSVPLSTMETAAKKLNINLQKMEEEGVKSQRAIRDLGLNFKEVAKLPVDEQMFKIGNALAKVEDDGKRTTLAMELFGKAGTDLIPVFGDGADTIKTWTDMARDAGQLLNNETIDAALKADTAFDNYEATMKRLTTTIGTQVVPVITKLVENVAPLLKQIAEWIGKNPEMISQLVTWGGAILAASTAIGTTVKVFESLKAVSAGLSVLSSVLTVLTGISLLQFAGIAALVVGLVWVASNWSTVTAGLESIWKALGLIDETSKEAEVSMRRLKQTQQSFSNGESGIKISNNPKYYGAAPAGPVKDYDLYMDIKGKGTSISAGNSWGSYDTSGTIAAGLWNTIRGFADGGDPPLNRPSIVGEDGPEMFIPKSAGTVVPNHSLGGTTIIYNITGNTLLDNQVAEKIVRMGTRKFFLNNKVA